jgi:hypothetical protein
MKYVRSAGLALFLGVVVYLVLIAQPRPIGWWVLVPIGVVVIAFLFRLPVEARNEAKRANGDPTPPSNGDNLR